MNNVLQFLFMSSSIWVFCLFSSPVLSHATDPPQLPPFHASLPPTPAVMQSMVQDKHVHLDKELLLAVIFSSVAITLAALSAPCACFLWRRNVRKPGPVQISDTTTATGLISGPVLNRFNPLSIRGSIPEVEYTLIEAATNNFSESNILRTVGCQPLYKAHFNFGCLAAVKRLDSKEPHSERAFESEIVLLSNVKHPNIISLLGYCVHGEAGLLVYELMQNGSLEAQLHGPSTGLRLTWHIRMKIALDAARGLEYLHEHCNPPVVHRALKSSNILLDSNFNAKISDFSLAISEGNHSEHRIKFSDTRGHVAPEYLLNGELTEKSDMYAFGVVLLELLMGWRSVERMTGSKSGITWAMPQLIDREKLPDIVDPVIRHTMDPKHLCQAY